LYQQTSETGSSLPTFTEKTGVGGRVWGVGVKRNSCRKWTPYSTPKRVESPWIYLWRKQKNYS